MKSRKCANYERHGWMEDAEDPRSFCTHCEIERLRAEVKRLQEVIELWEAEMRSLATSNGNTINDLEADLHMAWAKIDTALTLIENRSLNTTSASVMGNVIAALEGK